MTEKDQLRKTYRQQRRQQPDKDAVSERIFACLAERPFWQSAKTILFYLDVRDEVRTSPAIIAVLATGRRVVVPYCLEEKLLLAQIRTLDEVASGAFGIREPISAVRENVSRRIDPGAIDVALIPGVAFDRHGHRIGSGRGYYDRLIPKLAEDCIRVGLAYSAQLSPPILAEPHDQPVHFIITEHELIDCRSGPPHNVGR